MKKILLLIVIFFVAAFQCFAQIELVSNNTTAGSLTVYIQPLGNVETKNIDVVVNSLKSFYGCKVVVNTPATLTKDLLAKSNSRYEAGKILKKFNNNKNLLIITEQDIACRNAQRNVDEWGVFGLGYRPGKTCVVSTFRLNRRNPSHSRKLFNERLAKVSLHEIGHNLGLEHCTSGTDCLMKDAKGLIETVDNEKMLLCISCQKQL
jgi:archaemetzincin